MAQQLHSDGYVRWLYTAKVVRNTEEHERKMSLRFKRACIGLSRDRMIQLRDKWFEVEKRYTIQCLEHRLC